MFLNVCRVVLTQSAYDFWSCIREVECAALRALIRNGHVRIDDLFERCRYESESLFRLVTAIALTLQLFVNTKGGKIL